ncbi:MAG: fibronectin type III domain-containing protein [Spirochaetaceae bacterium]|nr:fibronectin type III domain-containing protein [Spirochaetaceae bacterium]
MKYTIRLRPVRAIVYSFFLVATLAMLGSCGMPFDWSLDLPDDWSVDGGADDPPTEPVPPESQPQVIVIAADHFTLFWDTPPDAASEYRVYHRIHGGSEWQLLTSGLASPEATVTQTDLEFGMYEFAVSSVSMDGVESDLHSSLDETADPGTGWYLDWIGG